MRHAAALVPFVVCLIFGGCAKRTPEHVESEGPAYVYLIMSKEDTPVFDFESSDFFDTSMWETMPDVDDLKRFRLSFTALRTGPDFRLRAEWYKDPKYQTAQFTGTLQRGGQDGVAVSGKLNSTIDLVLQFVKMVNASGDPNDEFPEMKFGPGEHEVSFTGSITGWYEDGATGVGRYVDLRGERDGGADGGGGAGQREGAGGHGR